MTAQHKARAGGRGGRGTGRGPHLLKLIGDGLGLLVPLEPHHVLGVESPRLLLQGLGCQVLRLRALEEEGWNQGSGGPHIGGSRGHRASG